MLSDGDRLFGQCPHAALHPLQQCLVQLKRSAGQDEQRVAEGVLHGDPLDPLLAHFVIKGLQEQENGAPLIGLHARPVLEREQLQRTVPVQGFAQLA